MSIRRIAAIIVCLCMTVQAFSQERKPERLKESRIESRSSSLRGVRIKLGLPERIGNENLKTNALSNLEYGEIISHDGSVWTSMNPDINLPNWVAWETKFLSKDKDKFMSKVAAPRKAFNDTTWNAVIDECYKWAWEKPVDEATIICGPLVYEKEIAKGEQAMPYEYFVVVCKRANTDLGWKSIGFVIPNRPKPYCGPYKISRSVNMIEFKTGYNFFKHLPDSIEELVEEMTPYELFSSFVDESEFLEMEEDPEIDPNELMNDYLEDSRSR